MRRLLAAQLTPSQLQPGSSSSADNAAHLANARRGAGSCRPPSLACCHPIRPRIPPHACHAARAPPARCQGRRRLPTQTKLRLPRAEVRRAAQPGARLQMERFARVPYCTGVRQPSASRAWAGPRSAGPQLGWVPTASRFSRSRQIKIKAVRVGCAAPRRCRAAPSHVVNGGGDERRPSACCDDARAGTRQPTAAGGGAGARAHQELQVRGRGGRPPANKGRARWCGARRANGFRNASVSARLQAAPAAAFKTVC